MGSRANLRVKLATLAGVFYRGAVGRVRILTIATTPATMDREVEAVPVVNWRDPRVLRSAFTADAAARAGGGLLTHGAAEMTDLRIIS